MEIDPPIKIHVHQQIKQIRSTTVNVDQTWPTWINQECRQWSGDQ